MSGHSKWSTIKRKKEKTDGARAKVFVKNVTEQVKKYKSIVRHLQKKTG